MAVLTVSRDSKMLYRGDSISSALSFLQSDRHAWNAIRVLAPISRPVTFFSVCSGIEAASVAWKPLGWKCVGVAEIEKFPSAVLAHHYPNVPNYGDFTKIDPRRIGRIDVLCGGTPCQSFSVAGARKSLDDARGNLTLAFVGLAHALNPRNVVWENVPGVLSTKDNAFGCFLGGLVGADDALPSPRGKRWPNAGMVSGPKGRAAWRVLDAQYFGLAQRRKRVIVVADFGNGADPAAVLFEPESVRRDSPPSRETGQGITGTISARAKGGGGLGTDFDLDGGLIHAPEIARCDATREGSSQDWETTTMVAVAFGGNNTSGPIDVATAVNAHGGPCGRLDFESETFVACVHGTQDPCTNPHVAFALGRNNGGENVIAFSAKDYGADAAVELSPTLRAGGHSESHANAAIVQSVALRGREDGSAAELGDDVAFALRASSGGGDKPHVLTSAVRRLTPRECERLQGFQWQCSPDDPQAWQDHSGRRWSPDYTAIPVRKVSAANQAKARRDKSGMFREIRGEMWTMASDGPRYKALGNSWAVPKFRWLGARIARLLL